MLSSNWVLSQRIFFLSLYSHRLEAPSPAELHAQQATQRNHHHHHQNILVREELPRHLEFQVDPDSGRLSQDIGNDRDAAILKHFKD